MTTKYNTGDVVLIPATILSAEKQGGDIFYHIRECAILVRESTIVGPAPDVKDNAPKILDAPN